MDDTIEKVLGYILLITGIVANITIIKADRKPKSKKRKKR